jgi:two-component system LytT family sensor kinase
VLVKDSLETFIANKDKPSFWLLHSLGWMSYVFIFTAESIFLSGGINKIGLEVFFHLLLSGIFAALLTWPLRFIYRQCWGLPTGWLITVIMLCSFLVTVIWTLVKNNIIFYFYEDFDVSSLMVGTPSENFRMYVLFMSVSCAFFIIFVWSTLYFSISYHFRLIKENKLHLEAVRLSHIAQIKMLRYQINPHFLFNTLNAISTLVLRGSKVKANSMLIQLATFLRFSLDNDPEKKIRFNEELKALLLYLEIEKTRFGDRLRVKFQVELKAESLLVPSLLLQPLVENSIKHAIAHMFSGGVIEVTAKCQQGYLHMEVADNGPVQDNVDLDTKSEAKGQTASSETAVGLQNIVERLNVLYPDKHSFNIIRGLTEGFSVQISIPMEYL